MLQSRPLLATAADARLFVDREEELRQLERSVRRGFNVAVHGERGVGKTSVLHYVEYKEREERRVAYVDATGAENVAELLERVRSAVIGEAPAARTAMEQAAFAFRGLTQGGRPGESSTWLAEQIRSLGEIDSAVILVDASGAPDAVYGLFGQLRDELWQLEHRWIVSVDTRDWPQVRRPPADAFFDITIELPRFDETSLLELLTRRDPELESAELAQIAMESGGNPRRALELARQTLIRERPIDDVLLARALREQAASELGRPHAMLLAELEDSNQPRSPSDERLLERMGWTRERAGQVFRDLEEVGIVSSVQERQPRGRPRKLYFPNQHAEQRLRVLNDFRGALESGEVEVHYQPIVDLKQLQVRGAEALVRWQHPERGLLLPADFIPAVEQTGMIVPLTLYVLDQALTRCAAWRNAGHRLTVAVNLSVRNISDPTLPGQIEGMLSERALPTDALTLEVTEAVLMSDPERTPRIIDQLSTVGVRLSVDDFGTGYSSLTALRRLPIREIKIDRSFVTRMDQAESDQIIVSACIHLAHDLGWTVVAEGVETETTATLLTKMGCDRAQGYDVGRPMTGEAFDDWIQVHLSGQDD